MVKNDKTNKPTNDWLATVLSSSAKSSEIKLAEADAIYRVIIESPDGMLYKATEYGKLTDIVAKLKSALPKGIANIYRVHITDSEDKLVWEIEPEANYYTRHLVLIRYRNRPHWWNREPRIKWAIVDDYQLGSYLTGLNKGRKQILGANGFNFNLAMSTESASGWLAKATTIITEALNGYTTEE